MHGYQVPLTKLLVKLWDQSGVKSIISQAIVYESNG
jgi:hypothetical protein